jgi:AcrR family transcriptional regulator
MPVREPLTRERVLHAALAMADEGGVEALSMRRLAKAVGVEAMSLYNHVANKEDLIDGLVDIVWAEIDAPSPGEDWKLALRKRADSTRAALLRHPWAVGLMEARSHPGPANRAVHEAVLACLRRAGFSVAATARAYSLQDSFIYGFALQERALPAELGAEVAARMIAFAPTDELPYTAEMLTEHIATAGYDFDAEFAFGLDLILDALERLR